MARPHPPSNAFHVWQKGARQSTIAVRVFLLPSSLNAGDAITGEFKFTTETKSVSTTVSAADAAGARTITIPLPADLPSFCLSGCAATLVVYPDKYPSKVVRLPVQFFNYKRPVVKSVFPRVGSEQGGTLVSILVEDYPGSPAPSTLTPQHTLPPSLLHTHTLFDTHTHTPPLGRTHPL